MSSQYPVDRWSNEYAAKRAKDAGCTVEIPNDNELQLDLDSDEAVKVFQNQMYLLNDLDIIRVLQYQFRISKSGRRHVVVKLDDPVSSPLERILLQACLGSDLERELLSYVGLMKGQPNPTLLFRPKEDTWQLPL